MELYDGEIDAFTLGAAIGCLATFFILTREKRAISRIKSDLQLLACHHNLTEYQYKQTLPPLFGGSATLPLASDEKILTTYDWAVRIREESRSLKRLSPTILAAEVIICEKLLGLTHIHAVRTLLRTKDLDELQQNLHDVTAEISAEENSN
jgi:hypothetical protein